MNGGRQVATILKAHNIDCIFTLCGGHISPILVESKRLGIKIIDVRNEANAAFSADAYSRLSGNVGVAAVTAGPGVTNTLTAIKNAQLAQSPLLLLGGATATMLRGRGSLQDIDQMELIEPHVKWAARPNRLKEVAPAIQKALKIAQEGVPGPVFVELAVDLLYEESIIREWYKAKTDIENPSLPEKVIALYIKNHLHRVFSGKQIDLERVGSPYIPTASKSEVKEAIQMIKKAAQPVLVLGSQALLAPNKSNDLISAIEKLNIPIWLSGMGRGLLGKDHPLQMRHKRTKALKEADLVILCGVPCDFRLDYGSPLRNAKVISINRSRKDLYQNRRPNLPILADPHITLAAIAKDCTRESNQAWMDKLRGRHNKRHEEIVAMAEDEVSGINPLQFFLEMDKYLTEDSILVGDGGDFVASGSYILQPRAPYAWLDPGVFGTLGVGAGFALSAKVVKPDSDVWLVYGDGAAGFSIMEFDTCARHKLGIIAVVGNDAGWTQIARDQIVILKDAVGTELTAMDYHVVAQGCGGHGIKVEKMEDVPKALEEALKFSRKGIPVLINVIIGKTDFRKGSLSM